MSQKPVPVLRKEVESSHLLRDSDVENKLPIAVLELPSRGQTHISLGDYTQDRLPQGFTITVTPDFEQDEVETQITRLEAIDNEFELFLHTANYSDREVIVEVFPLPGDTAKATNKEVSL